MQLHVAERTRDGAASLEQPIHSPAGAVVSTHPLYLATRPDPVFVTVHLPDSIRAGTAGVVVCPPFGWDEICTCRTRRAWANALAEAGFPALRLDLPGTGDSPGSPRDGDRLSAWTAAVGGAADWLRQEIGCGRITGLGIGFGGMMAWLAAARGAPIDDLALWAVPMQGRRLLRETRASADLSIDYGVEGAPAPQNSPSSPDDGDLLDEAGLITTKETVDAIASLDLTKLALPNPSGRRVLLFERPGVAADKRLRDHVESTGAAVTTAPGDSYGAMMRYARFAEVPTTAITESISWLRADGFRTKAPALAAVTSSRVRSFHAIEFLHDGVAVRERSFSIQFEWGRLSGVISEPVGVPTGGVSAVLLNNGSDRRIGPNRMWVETARRWAARGVPTVRFDQRGIGDSDGGENYYLDIERFYDARATDEVIAILDYLEGCGLPDRFALVGFCSSAYYSFQAALVDERVLGAFMINAPFFYRAWWDMHVPNGWVSARKHRQDDPWFIAWGLSTLKGMLRALIHSRRLLLRARRLAPDRVDAALKHLSDQGTEVLLMFKPDAHLYHEILEDRHFDRIAQLPNVTLARIPGCDVRFRPLALQRFVSDELDRALTRTLESDRAASPKLRIVSAA